MVTGLNKFWHNKVSAWLAVSIPLSIWIRLRQDVIQFDTCAMEWKFVLDNYNIWFQMSTLDHQFNFTVNRYFISDSLTSHTCTCFTWKTGWVQRTALYFLIVGTPKVVHGICGQDSDLLQLLHLPKMYFDALCQKGKANGFKSVNSLKDYWSLFLQKSHYMIPVLIRGCWTFCYSNRHACSTCVLHRRIHFKINGLTPTLQALHDTSFQFAGTQCYLEA